MSMQALLFVFLDRAQKLKHWGLFLDRNLGSVMGNSYPASQYSMDIYCSCR